MTKQEKIAEINAKLAADIAAAKAQKEQTIADYYAKVAELQRAACDAKNHAVDDDEQQSASEDPVVWVDGKQHTAVNVARRILRKLPSIPYNCSIDISLLHYSENGVSLQVKAYNPNRKGNSFESLWMFEHDEPEKQAADISDWMERVDKLLSYKPTNDHVEEPIGSALDAMFGDNPLDDFPTLDRKEDDNE